jgi:hypothetical protein
LCYTTDGAQPLETMRMTSCSLYQTNEVTKFTNGEAVGCELNLQSNSWVWVDERK